ncbi:MAG: hypothetical protein ACXVA2_22955 [Mucilaginibacter sp.]
MTIHNKTYLCIGIALVVASVIWSSLGGRDRYSYDIGLTVVGIVYIVLAFNKPQEIKS